MIISYTLRTVNANSHALMSRYQQPGSEKRMLAILNEGAADAWLSVRPEKAREFMRAYSILSSIFRTLRSRNYWNMTSFLRRLLRALAPHLLK